MYDNQNDKLVHLRKPPLVLVNNDKFIQHVGSKKMKNFSDFVKGKLDFKKFHKLKNQNGKILKIMNFLSFKHDRTSGRLSNLCRDPFTFNNFEKMIGKVGVRKKIRKERRRRKNKYS